MGYFLNLTKEEQLDRAKRMCTDVTPGIIFTNSMEVPEVFLNEGNKAAVPIITSPRNTTRVIVRITNYLGRSEEHTSELQSRGQLVCRLLLEKTKPTTTSTHR